MALDAFLDFKGAIKGSVTQKTREGKIRVFAVDHIMSAPADSATGFPGKTVMPGALIATKSVDLSSAPMQGALQEGKKFGSVNLEMWRMPPGGGVEENHYILVMTGVRIRSIRTVLRFNKPQDASLLPETEEIEFTYEGISFTYKGADGANSAGPFLRDKFDDQDDSLKAAVEGGLKGAAKDLGNSIGTSIKEALKPKEEPPKAG